MELDSGNLSSGVTVETIRVYADLSIRRGCGFALLGVCCVMFGYSFDLALSFRMGALLVLLLSAVLYYKALNAPRRPYTRTEVWIMLPERPRAGKAELQALIGGILAERFWWHTKAAAMLSAGLAAAALVFWLGST